MVNEAEEKITVKERLYTLGNPKLSKSAVNCYLECPFQFHTKYVNGNNELDKNFYPFLYGIDVHGIFEKFYIPGETDLNKLIKNVVMNYKYIKYKKLVDNFIEFNKELKENMGDNFIPYKTEFRIKNEKLNVSGVIDRVQFDGEKYIVIDYKQRGADYFDDNGEVLDKYKFELAVYTYLFEQETGLEVGYWGIYFAKDGKLLYSERKQEDIDAAIRIINETRENINKELKGEQKIKRCEKCRYCKKYE